MKFLNTSIKPKQQLTVPILYIQGAPISVGGVEANPPQMIKVDEVYRKDGQIIVVGWCTAKLDLDLKAADKSLDVLLTKVRRPDVASHFGLPQNHQLGFALIADYAGSEAITLGWRNSDGQAGVSQPLNFATPSASTSGLPGQFNSTFDDPAIGVFAIDHAIALGSNGLLLYGWRHLIDGKVKAVRAHGTKGRIIDITNTFFLVSRMDVFQALQSRFPDMSEFCGFVCHIPLPTNVGDFRLLEVESDAESQWLRIPIPREQLKGVPLIKDLLTRIPSPEKIRPQLFDLFDRQIGQAIDSISTNRPKFSRHIAAEQFGTPPRDPRISIIIPLYGRYDFLRYQLSHFADDPDFLEIDLIYVIDDPSIIVPTNDLASTYYPIFRIPFRTVSYDCNLGFGGANNVGVRLARGETVLLMNSDVLPKRTGWVLQLQQALDTLPDAGAVGPLLQFSDDSVQHAGMVSKRDARLPGFLLNVHPGKGQPWEGPNTPRECAMLTAACLMLSKKDYVDLGGFDEGYVIGDFEDSDLCLALRKGGKRLWLVPEAKLWHLERQSQNVESIAGYRQLLTLFNGWRFQKKVREGLIADPSQHTELEI